MIVSHLIAKNWRNFRSINVPLQERVFFVGPNASGKSNLLDIFRFLRDIAKPEGGGLQKALRDRGGVSKVRSLSARKDPEISIEIRLSEQGSTKVKWKYLLAIKQQSRAFRLPYVSHEKVYKNGRKLFERPNEFDKVDRDRLTQTYLEQINTNHQFREVAKFLQSITYLHLVPQLLRFADRIQGRVIEDDPFGQSFLERVARTPEKTRNARFHRIEEALKIAVPQLKQLGFDRDKDTGKPHIQAMYSHWRQNAGWQREDQFSDGTLRLIGLLWSLLESDSLLLLEEPELSLNAGIVIQLAPLINRLQKLKQRQVLVSTHSDALLREEGIDGRETILLTPKMDGTEVCVASALKEVRTLLQNGFSVAEAVLPRTNPKDISAFAKVK